MDEEGADRRDIRSIAVTVEDVVAAVETNRTTDRTAVLRITPPARGRVRARLHRADTGDDEETIHLDPERLLSGSAPAYPRPADTEDRLRADSDRTYDIETHRAEHERAVEAWRAAVGRSIRETVTLETDEGTREVDVAALG